MKFFEINYNLCKLVLTTRVALLRVLGPPLDHLDPFSYTLKMTNGSNQNCMDPLNFMRHGMPEAFTVLLTQKIVIMSIQKILKMMTQKTKEIFFRWATFISFDS